MKCRCVIKKLAFCGLFATVLASCTSEDDKTVDKEPFNRQAMLENYGSNVILPAYQEFKTQSSLLQAAVEQLAANPTATNLTTAREAYRSTYLAWQHASAFEFGPAMTEDLLAQTNIFPTDTAEIKANISNATFNMAQLPTDNKGLPAIDYLLFSRKTSAATLANLQANPNQKQYLQSLANHVSLLASAVYTAWAPNGGNYVNTFSTRTGTDAGSSVSILVNHFNSDFEILKNAKLAIPVGRLGGGLGNAMPDKTEAYFADKSVEFEGLSKTLALEHLNSTRTIYTGANGLGLDDYLNHLEAKSYEGGNLHDAITAQFNTFENALKAIPVSISSAVVTNKTAVEKAYTEARNVTVLIKNDLPSALTVLISYADTDGD